MSKEEEAPARVTRSALRRMSIEQEPSSTPGTPKKTATSTKKSAILDAIQEGTTSASDADVDASTPRLTTKGKKDASVVGNKSLLKIKEQEGVRPPLRSRAASLTEDNVNVLESAGEVRRTPRRRASQDMTLTPQTGPTVTRRLTRRNSTTSEDGNVPTTTPKASKSRLSVAPPTIAEDDEKEDKHNSSNATVAEAELSDLDIRKLRNRSISKSPVPKSSPSGKNTSIGSQKTDESKADTTNISSPLKQTQEPKDNESVSDESVEKTPTKSEGTKSTVATPVGSEKKLNKDVTFEENTPGESNKSVYPKTPIAHSVEKRRKISTKDSEDSSVVLSVTPEVVDETMHESPQKTAKNISTTTSPTKVTTATPHKADKSLDKSIDKSLANIVEDVRENIDQIDQSMSILGTPKPIAEQKSRFAQLRKGSFSTPIAKLQEVEEEQASPDSSTAKSWNQAVKGTSDKGIDVFSVRKQEEEQRQEEQTRQLNESLKKNSSPKKIDHDERGDEYEEDEDDDEDEASERNSFVDDEAMEVEGYESGDSKDSETQADLDENVEDDGESIGSEDSDMEEEEDENDSFVVSDNDEYELLDGSGDDLGSEEEADTSKANNKRKRIIQQSDSSDEDQSVIELNDTTASESKSSKKENMDKSKSPKKTPKKMDMDEFNSPKKTSAKDDTRATPKKTSEKSSQVKKENHDHLSVTSNASFTAEGSDSPRKTPKKATSDTNANSKASNKSPLKNDSAEEQSLENSNASLFADQSMSPKKSPAEKTPVQTPVRSSTTTDVKARSATPLKVKQSETEEPTDVENKSSLTQEIHTTAEKSDILKSRQSLPAPAMISADFYASSKKAPKRNTINVLEVEKPAEQESEEPPRSTNLVTNPAALALARKNKRLSLGASPAESNAKKEKRASLPGKLPVHAEVLSPLKKKKKPTITTEESEVAEPMSVDECDDEAEQSPAKQPAPVVKRKPKDLSEFDTSAILARCNEIVRSDKEKRKQGATLKQKKKDEKRRPREEEEQQDDSAEANESSEQQKKKKKKKKKPINYLLEELGETKEDQVAKALQRKMAILEAKRERKKAKKAAKLQQQLNKENEQVDEEKKHGIGAKFEKKIQKEKKAKKEQNAPVEKGPMPVVKRAVSAFAIYSAQIEELKMSQPNKKKSKTKLKEKNQLMSVVEEVQEALGTKKELKAKKDKPTTEENLKKDKKNVQPEKEADKHTKKDQKKKDKISSKEFAVQQSGPKPNVKETEPEKPVKVMKKKDKPSHVVEAQDKTTKQERAILPVPLKSVVSTNFDDLAALKKSLMEPITKVIKKRKLSQTDSHSATTTTVSECTPPRKLKAVARFEQGFIEEAVTPEHQLLKRNHGFKEEPVTPKTIGFKVSNLLPAGQEMLQEQAILAKKKKTYSNSKRIRPEDVKEPAKSLPLPIWTRSGVFEVEEFSKAAQSKKSKPLAAGDILPLNSNGQRSTDFMVKALGAKKKDNLPGFSSRAHRIDMATVDESVLNFKKQAIFGKNAHLREKKSKH